MFWLWASLVAVSLLGQQPMTPGLYDLTADVSGVGRVPYGISIPRGFDPDRPTPLVVVLLGRRPLEITRAAMTRVLLVGGASVATAVPVL